MSEPTKAMRNVRGPSSQPTSILIAILVLIALIAGWLVKDLFAHFSS